MRVLTLFIVITFAVLFVFIFEVRNFSYKLEKPSLFILLKLKNGIYHLICDPDVRRVHFRDIIIIDKW